MPHSRFVRPAVGYDANFIEKSEKKAFYRVSYSLRVSERQLYRRRKAHKNSVLVPFGGGDFLFGLEND